MDGDRCPNCGDLIRRSGNGSTGALSTHLKACLDGQHGTRGGYLRHRRQGEDACQDCKDAHTEYERAQRRRRRKAAL